MNISSRKAFVFVAIIFSLVTVSSAWAAKECDQIVDGVIEDLSPPMNSLTVSTDEGTKVVYGIPRVYLENQGTILEVGDEVYITAINCNVTGVLEACTLEVNDDEVSLPGSRNPGAN